MSKRSLVLIVPVLAGLALAGCGDVTGSSSYSSVTMVVTPDPASAVKSTDSDYQWQTTVTVTLTSDNDVGATIAAVTGSVTESSGGIAVSGSVSSDDEVATYRTVVSSDSNRVEGNETKTFSVTMQYKLPSGRSEVLVSVGVTLSDDAGAAYTLSDSVTAK